MIHVVDIKKILAHLGYDGEAILDWCRRNGVDEPVMQYLAEVYAFNPESQRTGIDGFRLGHTARREDEPRSESRIGKGPRYAVEHVVIDLADGRIVGDPTPARDEAEGVAGSFNAIDAPPSGIWRPA